MEKKNNLRLGAIEEQEFILECLKKNGLVSIPIYPVRYDVLVDFSGKINRVQIKKPVEQKGYLEVNLSRRMPINIDGRLTSRTIFYQSSEIDFIASKVFGAWYIFGSDYFENKSGIAIYNEEHGQSKRRRTYLECIDRWDLLGYGA